MLSSRRRSLCVVHVAERNTPRIDVGRSEHQPFYVHLEFNANIPAIIDDVVKVMGDCVDHGTSADELGSGGQPLLTPARSVDGMPASAGHLRREDDKAPQ
jgi:hypothetical protein